MSNTHALQGTLPNTAPTIRRGHLFRAIVSLPEAMCPAGETFHERIVFFTTPADTVASREECLENLLSQVWNITAYGWCMCGHIYNITSEGVLVWDGVSMEADVRLFEVGWSKSQGAIFADPAQVDLLVAPALKLRLQSALAKVKAAA